MDKEVDNSCRNGGDSNFEMKEVDPQIDTLNRTKKPHTKALVNIGEENTKEMNGSTDKIAVNGVHDENNIKEQTRPQDSPPIPGNSEQAGGSEMPTEKEIRPEVEDGTEKSSAVEKEEEEEEELTWEQLAILREKAELEKLLEQTKLLQQQADQYLSRKEKKSEEQETRRTSSQSGSIPPDESKDVDSSTKQKLSEKLVSHEMNELRLDEDESELGVNEASSDAADRVSLRGNIRLLEENADLLHRKVELEMLLRTANLILEKTELQEMSEKRFGPDDLSQDSACPPSLEVSRSIGEADDKDPQASGKEEEAGKLKHLFEKADEITNKAKVFLQVIHDGKDSDLQKTELSQKEENKISPKSDDSAVRLASTTSDETLEFPKLLGKDKESESVSELTNSSEVMQVGLLCEGSSRQSAPCDADLQRLLQQANLLLERAKGINDPLEDSKETTFQDLGAISKTSTEEDNANGEDIARRKALEEAEALEENAAKWLEVQSTLHSQKQELDDLMEKTRQLQKDAEAIVRRNHLPESESAIQEGTPQMSGAEDPKTSEIKSSLEEKDTSSNNLEATKENCELSGEMPQQDVTQTMTTACEESSDDDDDDDDPSFDAKFELEQLLQRARLVLERSKRPISKTDTSAEIEVCPSEKEDAQELSVKLQEKSSDTAAGLNEGNAQQQQQQQQQVQQQSSSSERQSEMEQLKQKQEKEECEINSTDAELSFLIEQTKQLRQQADEYLNNQMKKPTESDPQTDAMLELSEEASKDNAQLAPKDTKHEVSEEMKHPEELKINRPNEKPDDLETDENSHKETEFKEAQVEIDDRLELEEIEESQLEIGEIEKSQPELEDEYLSDDSEMSDMMMYYEASDHSSEGETDLREGSRAFDKTQELKQSSKAEELPDDSQVVRPLQAETLNLPAEEGLVIKQMLQTLTAVPLLEKISLPTETPSDDKTQQTTLETDSISQKANVVDDSIQQLENMITSFENSTNEAKANEELETAKSSTDQSGSIEESAEAGLLSEQRSEFQSEPATDTTSQITSSASQTTECPGGQLPCPEHEVTLVPDEQKSSENSTELSQTTSLDVSPDFSEKLSQLKTEVALLLSGSKFSQVSSDSQSTSNDETNQRLLDNDNSVPLQSKMSDTSCSGHSKMTTIDHEETISKPPAITESEARTSDTGTGVPELDSKAAADQTTQYSSSSNNRQCNINSLSNVALLLKLQKEMAKMQLQVINLQDAMRVTNSTLQQLIEQAFPEE